MSSEKYLLFDLADDKSKKLGEIISNSTARKIVNLLADKEASALDISRELKMPLNTVGYNLSKLVDAGIIEKSKSWWSVKGRKIETYKVANKMIVISPGKSSGVYNKLKGIVPVVLTAVIFSAFILFNNMKQGFNNSVQAPTVASGNLLQQTAEKAADNVASGVAGSINSGLSITIWFLIAIWALLVLFVIYILKKK